MASDKEWLPLESNPDVMKMALTYMGLPEDWGVIDVFDLDDEFLDSVPKKVKAVLLLFPKGDSYEEHRQSEQEMIENEGQVVSDRVYFMKLDSRHSSGTVSIIHAVANATDDLNLAEDSPLKEFLNRTQDMSPEERGQELDMSETLRYSQHKVAKEGQTEVPADGEETNLHFVTFVSVDEQLYELDALKNFPINHGSTSEETLLKDSVAVCKKFFERDPDNMQFSILAVVASEDADE